MLAEKTFETKIKKFLKANDIWYMKVWGSAMQRAGIPDLLMCIKGRFVAVEVKGEDGVPSKLQLREIKAIQDSGGQALLLYPKDFDDFKKCVNAMIENCNLEEWMR